MSMPRTAAGRRLFTDNEPMDMWESDGVTWEDVIAIEVEAAAPAGLDVEVLGFNELLDVGEAILRNYPPNTIVCTHDRKWDVGPNTAAAIADLIATCRARLRQGTPA